MATFRCRKCRILLFSVRELESHTVSTDQVNQVSSDLASFDKCSSWFLKDEDILPWIAESVEEVFLHVTTGHISGHDGGLFWTL